MSVRIYQLSKQLGIDNKQVIALLRERGLDVDSPSNTIPNIYADALIEEFQRTQAPVKAEVEMNEIPAIVAVEAIVETEFTRESAAEVQPTAPAVADAVTPMVPQHGKVAPSISLRMPLPSMTKTAPAVQPSAYATQRQLDVGKYVRSVEDVEEAKRPVAPASQQEAKLTPSVRPNVHVPHTAPRQEVSPSVNLRPNVMAGHAPKLAPMPNMGGAPKISLAPMASPTTSSANLSAPTQKTSKQIVKVRPPIVVRDLALVFNVKPFRLISELMEMGVFASMNQTIDEGVAVKLAERHGFTLEIHHRGEAPQPSAQKLEAEKKKKEASEYSEVRPPIVCILGHVDHGKTTLLDTIRKTNVVSGEAGGITQHIGAYQVEHNGQKITFIDTPGHAAFSKMRQRGASITDVAVLVVAADDGFMPQTDEALKFIKKENVPVVVAVNKMDAKGANIERVKQQMQQRGITPEEWGGETLYAGVSALKGDGIDNLLSQILLQSEMEELRANPKVDAEGVVVESQIDIGRGPVATVLVQNGTLKVGDALICGPNYCKVRSLIDDRGSAVKLAPPSTPVRVVGWSDTPEAGATFKTVKNEKEAKQLAEECMQKQRHAASVPAQAPRERGSHTFQTKNAGLESLMAAIESSKQKELRVIIKGDVHGSVEALAACLHDIKSDKVALEVLQSEVGPINKNDVTLAHATQSTIIGFNAKVENGVVALAKHHSVRILQHNIIYELITQVREAMSELLDPEIKENKVGVAQVRQVFDLSKGVIAGCMVTEGRISRDCHVRLVRNNTCLHEGKIGTMKRLKDDVSEVKAGYECGIQINGVASYQVGDVIECFELVKTYPSL